MNPLGKQMLLPTGFAFQLWEDGGRQETSQGLNKMPFMEMPVQKEGQRCGVWLACGRMPR